MTYLEIGILGMLVVSVVALVELYGIASLLLRWYGEWQAWQVGAEGAAMKPEALWNSLYEIRKDLWKIRDEISTSRSETTMLSAFGRVGGIRVMKVPHSLYGFTDHDKAGCPGCTVDAAGNVVP